MNTKKIIKQYEDELKTQFPGLTIYEDTSESQGAEEYLVYLQYPEDEEQKLKFRSFAADLSMKYLDKYDTFITPLSGISPISQDQ